MDAACLGMTVMREVPIGGFLFSWLWLDELRRRFVRTPGRLACMGNVPMMEAVGDRQDVRSLL